MRLFDLLVSVSTIGGLVTAAGSHAPFQLGHKRDVPHPLSHRLTGDMKRINKANRRPSNVRRDGHAQAVPVTLYGSNGAPTATVYPSSAPVSPSAENPESTGASAVECQAAVGTGENDALVLNFALHLELLELEFYMQGLKKFSVMDFQLAGFSHAQIQILVESIGIVAFDEQAHVTALQAALTGAGASTDQVCQFDFSAALTSPEVFIATARALEQVGVSAYEGGVSLIDNKSILVAAAGIHAIEARHSALLNVLNGGSPAPQPFDMALLPQQVLALAGGFMTGCKAEDLGLTTNEPLSIRNKRTGSTSFRSGDQLAFTSTIGTDGKNMFCAMLVGGAPSSINLPLEACIIPAGIDGPVYVFITSDATPLASDVVVQDTSTTLAGPGLIFVEGEKFLLGQVFTKGDKSSREDTNKLQSEAQEDVGKLVDGYNQYKDYKDGHASADQQSPSSADNQVSSYPGADLGYVNLCMRTGQVNGDANEWWSNHPIAVQETIGVNARVVGWSVSQAQE